MINLIPNEEKKIIIRDFYFRFSIVVLVAFIVITSLFIATLLPSYFLSSVKRDIVTTKLELEISDNLNQADQEILSTISVIDANLTLIEQHNQNKFLVSEKVINEILANKISGIKIDQISFDGNDENGRKISIRGIAPSRERLALFRSALENDASFRDVDLPISNFVKGSNIQFYLSLFSF